MNVKTLTIFKHREQFDPTYTESVGREVIEPLADHYFRLKTVGLEQLPGPNSERPIIFVANHAGRTFPWDAVLLDLAISRHWLEEYGVGVRNKPSPLVAPELSRSERLIPYRLQNWWHRVGCVDATASNFVRLLKRREHTIIFPEGIPGIARDFKYRYQLLPFPTPLVRLAQRHNAWLVPVSIIGSEYFHPFARRVDWIEKLGKRLGLPFLHLSPLTALLPLLPWLFYAALPAPTTIVFGPPLEPEQPGEDLPNWEAVSQRLRQRCQQQLNEARSSYERGMDWPGLVSSLVKAPEPFWKLLPSYWPQRFIQHARRHAPHLFPELTPAWWFWLPFIGWAKPPVAPTPLTVPQFMSEPQPVLIPG